MSPENDVSEQLARRGFDRTGGTCIGRARPHRRDAHRGRGRFSGQTHIGRYSWARYYHPGLQRFISEDPIGFEGGDPNLYAYVSNDPTNDTDPLGEFGLAGCGAGVLGSLAWDAGAYLLSGRKPTVGSVLTNAAIGCASGAVGGFLAGRIAGKLGTTKLYRAVMNSELDDIIEHGVFRNSVGVEVKYFSTSLEGAASYAKQAFRAFGDGPFTIVETAVPTRLISNAMRATVDRGISTVTIPTSMLRNLSAPRILNNILLPLK